MSAAERASEASSAEQANEWAVRANERSGGANGPVLTSRFLAVLNHRGEGQREAKTDGSNQSANCFTERRNFDLISKCCTRNEEEGLELKGGGDLCQAWTSIMTSRFSLVLSTPVCQSWQKKVSQSSWGILLCEESTISGTSLHIQVMVSILVELWIEFTWPLEISAISLGSSRVSFLELLEPFTNNQWPLETSKAGFRDVQWSYQRWSNWWCKRWR